MDKTDRQTMKRFGLTLASLVDDIRSYAAELATYDPADIADDEGNATGDIRLQLVDGGWTLHTGDACYDTDHRGAWGSQSIAAGASLRVCRTVAWELIDEALYALAEQEAPDKVKIDGEWITPDIDEESDD